MIQWLGPRSSQVARPPLPSPTSEEEAGEVPDLVSPLLATSTSHPAPESAPRPDVPLQASARPRPPSSTHDLMQGSGESFADPRDPPFGAQRLIVRAPQRRGEETLAGDDARRGQGQVGDGLSESSPAIPVLIPPVLHGSILLGYPPGAIHQAVDRSAFAPALRAMAEEGRVLLKVFVQTDGRVGRVEVAASSGVAVLDDTAVGAAWGWRFDPATRDGNPIAAWALVPVVFTLR